MKARLRSVRIAPKKANLVAGMVRGLTVKEALTSLSRTNKKAARLLERLVASAAANAKHNENQDVDALVIKTLKVDKAQAYHRGVPMARGRVRPMRKFLSHIELVLGIDGISDKPEKKAKKSGETASQSTKKSVKSTGTTSKKSTKSEKSASAKADTTASDSGSSQPKSPSKSS